MTAALNAANERANELFRKEKIGYLDIARVIEGAMESHKKDLKLQPSLEDIIEVSVRERHRGEEEERDVLFAELLLCTCIHINRLISGPGFVLMN